MTSELAYIIACAAGVVSMSVILLACTSEDGADRLTAILSGAMNIVFAIIIAVMGHKTISKAKTDDAITWPTQKIVHR
jgi:FtsH-binding integral membrane protein